MTDRTETVWRGVSDFDEVLKDMERLRQSFSKTKDTAEKGFGAAIDNASKKLDAAGRRMSTAGRNLTVGVTAPIAGIATVALKSAIDFEQAFTGVIKTVDATDAELGRLEAGIRRMATEIPVAATELARIGELAGQLGIRTENIEGFIDTIAKIAVATNLTTEQAATGFARLANIMETPQEEIDKLGSVVVELGNNLATTEAEILEMSLRIAGAGKQVGLTEDQVFAFGAALSSVGIEAQAGGTAISRAFIQIAGDVEEGGERLELFAQTAGVSADQFAEKFRTDAAGAMIDFIEGLRRISDEGGNVFGVLDELGLGEIRVRDALLRASGAGDLFRRSLNLAGDEIERNNALNREAELFFGTTENQLKLLKQQFTDAAIELGKVLIPFLKDLVEILRSDVLPLVKRGIEFFSNLPQPIQKNVVVIAALLALLGPFLVALGFIASSIASLLPVLKLLVGSFKLVGLAFRGLFLAMNLIAAHPIILVLIALVALAVLIVRNWDKIAPVLRAVGGAIFDFLVAAVQLAKAAWDAFWHGWKRVGGAAMDFLIGAVEGFRNFFVGIWNGITGAVLAAWNAYWSAWKAVGSAAMGFVLGVVDGFRAGVSRAFGLIRDTVLGAIDAFRRFRDQVLGFLSNMRDRLTGIVDGAVGTLRRLDPFARGSPSLVELVRKGTEAIQESYESLSGLEVEGPRLGTPQGALAQALGLTDPIGIQANVTTPESMTVAADLAGATARAGDQIIINNPKRETSEESLRSLALKRNILGADAGPVRPVSAAGEKRKGV